MLLAIWKDEAPKVMEIQKAILKFCYKAIENFVKKQKNKHDSSGKWNVEFAKK